MSADDSLTPEDRRLWARVSGSVTPRRHTKPPLEGATPPTPVTETNTTSRPASRRRSDAGPASKPAPTPPSGPARGPGPVRQRGQAEALEPRRQRRLARERDTIDARLDLHGYGRFEAQDVLTAFLLRCQARGDQAVLIITGQGRRGGSGIIRASIHEWLAAPALRPIISGFAPAARKHGGDGAMYVTLRRAV